MTIPIPSLAVQIYRRGRKELPQLSGTVEPNSENGNQNDIHRWRIGDEPTEKQAKHE